jgi:Fe-S cluster assembly iron-binding protein IscA
MIEISDSAREEINRTVEEQNEDKAVRVYIAGHG